MALEWIFVEPQILSCDQLNCDLKSAYCFLFSKCVFCYSFSEYLLACPSPSFGYCGRGYTPVIVSVTGAESDAGENRITKLS